MHYYQSSVVDELQKCAATAPSCDGGDFCCGLILAVPFLLSADFFQSILFLQNSFRNAIRVSNSLDSDQARHYVRPDLRSNCLQKLSVEDTRTKTQLIKLLHKNKIIPNEYCQVFNSKTIIFYGNQH